MKDTIYVDIDDEITSIIDKVKSSDKKIIALVLPKRASVLQSIVNMRLLKRSADAANKNLVLITTEAGIMPLAGMVGLHVARNLQSKPEIPPTPDVDGKEAVATIADGSLDDTEVDPNKSVGELADEAEGDKKGKGKAVAAGAAAGVAAGAVAAHAAEAEAAPIEIDAAQDAADAAAADAPIEIKPEKKNKKLAVPNFNKFRVIFFLGSFGLFVIGGGLYYANVVMPKAQVNVKAELTEIPVTKTFTVSTATKEFDQAKAIVPATTKTIQKPDQEKFPATGEVDKGTKATGSMTIYNCSKDDKLADRSVTVPAGTGVSAGEFTFITNQDVTVEPSSFVGNNCQNNKSSDVNVTAQNAGDKYNLSARKYTVAGFPSMSGTGTAMSGGTSKIAKVISPQDFEVAKTKLMAHNTDALKADLTKQLEGDGLTPLPETFAANYGTITSTPPVGEEANEGVASANVTYTMQGVSGDDLNALITDSLKGKYDPNKEKLYDNGVASMTLKLGEKSPKGEQPVIMATTVSTGPKLDEEAIKKAIVGKKRGEAKSTIESRPGVKEATVYYSPFWVIKAPNNLNRITVKFEVPASSNK